MLPGMDPLARLRASTQVELWEQERPPATEELAQRSKSCNGLLTMLTDRIDSAMLDRCPAVRVIANMAVGYDNIDVAAATAHGVLVTNTPGVLTETTADLAFALLLATARRLSEGERAVRNGSWGPWHPTWLLGRQVHGATLGIVGLGRIGSAMARRGAGFGMRVLYHSTRQVPDASGEYVSFEQLLERSDFVSVHVPLTPDTKHMFDTEAFALMQPHAVFVNTSRGGVVDQDALRSVLLGGKIGAAALDVTTPEPLPPDDPLLDAPNLLLVPHMGSATEITRERMAMLAVDGLLAGLSGKRPEYLVNAEAWERRR